MCSLAVGRSLQVFAGSVEWGDQHGVVPFVDAGEPFGTQRPWRRGDCWDVLEHLHGATGSGDDEDAAIGVSDVLERVGAAPRDGDHCARPTFDPFFADAELELALTT